MGFLRDNQLDIMLFLSGICAILAFMTLAISSESNRKKSILALMELSATFLLLAERFSYIYRGDPTELGFLMVRLSNGLVFFLQLFITHLVTEYLRVMVREDCGFEQDSPLLQAAEVVFGAGTLLIVVNQFIGVYYTIDSNNIYSRTPGFLIAYIFPLLIVILQETTIFKLRDRLNRKVVVAMMAGIALPTLISIVQIFTYGLSLTSISMVVVVIIFYTFALRDLISAVETARRNELESHREAERREAAMFEQTAESLANAIDAKDRYTHGHSTRVAAISKQIAERAGLSEEECRQVYFSALLHDVGKIGVPDDIINKEGKLTDEEFEQIKQHPILGYQILSSIKQSPELSVGAHYHHERYDGTGYPDGLKGEEIPQTARIIAVADAYDAMTSTRSYRKELSEEKTKDELIKSMGTQFDPKYAQILLDMLAQGTDPVAIKH